MAHISPSDMWKPSLSGLGASDQRYVFTTSWACNRSQWSAVISWGSPPICHKMAQGQRNKLLKCAKRNLGLGALWHILNRFDVLFQVWDSSLKRLKQPLSRFLQSNQVWLFSSNDVTDRLAGKTNEASPHISRHARSDESCNILQRHPESESQNLSPTEWGLILHRSESNFYILSTSVNHALSSIFVHWTRTLKRHIVLHCMQYRWLPDFQTCFEEHFDIIKSSDSSTRLLCTWVESDKPMEAEGGSNAKHLLHLLHTSILETAFQSGRKIDIVPAAVPLKQ